MVIALIVSAYNRFLDEGGSRMNQTITDRLFARTLDGPIPDPSPVLNQPRRVAAFGAFLIASLLLMLYAHRRQRYTLEWLSAWTLLAAGMFVLSRSYPTGFEGARAGAAILMFSTVGAAMLLFRSGTASSRRRLTFRGCGWYSRRCWRGC